MLPKMGEYQDGAYLEMKALVANADGGYASSKIYFESLHALSSAELAAAEVVLGDEIGRGAFGVVYTGSYRGEVVAVKKALGDETSDFRAEMERIRGLPVHPNIVPLVGVCVDPLMIVMGFCEGGSLEDWLKDTESGMLVRWKFLEDIAAGLEHLHKHEIVHRDLAARNVLLTGDGVAVLADFGRSRRVVDDGGVVTTSMTGPVKWMAPEEMMEKKSSRASDVFAFGVVCYEVLTREKPWPGLSARDAGMKVLKGERMEKPDEVRWEVWEVVSKCWAHEAGKRPGVEEVRGRLGGMRGLFE